MGRIKTKQVKRLGLRLVKEHSSELSADFLKNKEVVGGFLVTSSPKIKNMIAGYVTRLMKSREQ